MSSRRIHVLLLAAAGTCCVPPTEQAPVQPAAIRLELPPSLRAERSRYERVVHAAAAQVVRWFRRHGLELGEQELLRAAVVFEHRQAARRLMADRFRVDPSAIPATFAGTVDGPTLYLVRRQDYEAIFRTIYPDYAWSEEQYTRLAVHELAHRAHALIASRLQGSEDAMGPRWFFEGLAILCADQFAPRKALAPLSWRELATLVDEDGRRTLLLFAAVGIAGASCAKSEAAEPKGGASAGGGGEGAAGGAGGAGGAIGAGGAVGDGAKKAKGSACTTAANCQSDHCVDGVCCEENCGGLCEVCWKELGASNDGTCPVLPKGSVCRAAVGDCDVSGSCDGTSGECPADLLVPDGQPSAGEKCAPYQCDGQLPACPSTCASHVDCTAGYSCYGGKCTKKPGGEPCGGAGECLSGNCADGVCCDAPCAELCRACTEAKTGGQDGLCGHVSVGTDPDGECVPGTCDGSGLCATGAHFWSKRFGAWGNDSGSAVALDPAGQAAVTGGFYGPVDFGGGPLASAGGSDIFVAKFAP